MLYYAEAIYVQRGEKKGEKIREKGGKAIFFSLRDIKFNLKLTKV